MSLTGHRMPLGQPNKAIGLESPIEPWLAHCRHAACRRSRTARRTQQLMDRDTAQRSTTEPHTGLDVRHLPSPSPCGRGEVFSLDIPFYRTSRKTMLPGPLAISYFAAIL